MGKKSLVDAAMLPSAERQGLDELEVSVPAQQSALDELFQELVRVALRAHVETQESRSNKQVNDYFNQIPAMMTMFTYISMSVFYFSGGRLAYEDFRELHSEYQVTRACHGYRAQIISSLR